ncbi:hypothetical protein BCR35DRAFT_299612 [Leucosporidium creatinivorum]|uniref:MYND-type domain-containing protein n=1 Tax=Leucosporidium creatinivorum TaxID=106004 RepID=A0A1Y2G217_9BASI|nr:hypothetical protein BCR35DRAFT_299612 [Leucosporidium creatinivorum]
MAQRDHAPLPTPADFTPEQRAEEIALVRAAEEEARELLIHKQPGPALRTYFATVPRMAMACGEDSVEVATSWHGMAEGLICAEGKLPVAKDALREAFRIRHTLGKGSRLDAAMTRELYGMFHELMGDGQAAKEVRMLGAAKSEMRCGFYECPGGLFSSAQLKRCSGCGCIFYCSVECQKKSWPHHKQCCLIVKASLAAKSSA